MVHKEEIDAFGRCHYSLDLDKQKFTLANTEMSLVEVGGSGEEYWVLTLVVENVKLFCSECGSREVFVPVWYQDLTNEF